MNTRSKKFLKLEKNLPQEQIDMVEATLAKDRQNARELFTFIEDSMRGVEEGCAVFPFG